MDVLDAGGLFEGATAGPGKRPKKRERRAGGWTGDEGVEVEVGRLVGGFDRVPEPPIGIGSSIGADSRTSGRADREGDTPGTTRVESGSGLISIGASSESWGCWSGSRDVFGPSRGIDGRADGIVKPGIASTGRPTGAVAGGTDAAGVVEGIKGFETIGISLGGERSGPSPSPATARTVNRATTAKGRPIDRPKAARRSLASRSTLRLMDLSSIEPPRDDVHLTYYGLIIGKGNRGGSVDPLPAHALETMLGLPARP